MAAVASRLVRPFDEHLPCPALHRWLVPSWEGAVAAMWSSPPQPRWRPPRGLLRLLERADVPALGDDPPPASLDVLVVLSPLPEPGVELPDAGWSALRPGGTLVELASARRRGMGDLLRPWIRARSLREATAMRVRQWLERGAFAPEQWVTVEPADVVVTIVRRAVG